MAREQASVLRGGFLNSRKLPPPGYFWVAGAHSVGALPGERFYDGMALTHALKIRAAVGTNKNVAPVTFAIPFPNGTRVVYGVTATTWTMELWLENRPFAERLRVARQIAEVLVLMNKHGVQGRLTSSASIFVTGEGESAHPLFPERALTLRGELADKSAFQLLCVVASLVAPQAGAGDAGASEEAAHEICDSNNVGKLGADALAAALRCAECARTCTVCLFATGGPTVPGTPIGMECTNGHFTCAGCLDRYVASSKPTDVIQLGESNSFALKCHTCAAPFPVHEFNACLSERGFAMASGKLNHATAVHGARVAAADLEQLDHCEITLDQALGVRCPTCKLQFHKFKGCMMLYCSDCACPYFCACCMAPIGHDKDAAHAHVMRCPKNLTEPRDLYPPPGHWNTLRDGHILAQAQAAWALLSTADKTRLDARDKPIYTQARNSLHVPVVIVID